MEKIQEKIKNSSRKLMIFLRVLCISLIVGLCVPVFVLIYNAVNPQSDLFASGSLYFHSTFGYELNTIGEINAEMCTLLFSGILIFAMLFNAYKMFKSINAEIAPFNQSNAKRLENIGTELILYTFFTPIVRNGFYKSFAPDVNYHISFEISFLALALLFFFIAKLFEYGAELQRQSDETL
jgi:heme/copper-type cytochrome/quinol oxidase subunit 3